MDMNKVENNILKANRDYFDKDSVDFDVHFDSNQKIKDSIRRLISLLVVRDLGVQRIELILQMLGPSIRGSHIVELGCGHGRNLVEFIKGGAVVTGVDFSENMLQLARDKLSDESFASSSFNCCQPTSHI